MRAKKRRFVSEYVENENTVEYFIHYIHSDQYVLIKAEGMKHEEVKKLFSMLSNSHPVIMSLDNTTFGVWEFEIEKYSLRRTTDMSPIYMLKGKAPSRSLKVGFQNPSMALKSLSMALTYAREAHAVSYSLDEDAENAKWFKKEKEILKEIKAKLKRMDYVHVKVKNMVTGEKEEYVLNNWREFNKLVEEIAGRNPFGRYEVRQEAPFFMRIGPFEVTFLGRSR